jgi:hypothetical protein
MTIFSSKFLISISYAGQGCVLIIPTGLVTRGAQVVYWLGPGEQRSI